MKSKYAKIAGVATGLAFALSASTAGAQTTAETIATLQAQINALMAQLAALQGGTTTTTTACTFTRSLTVGAQGADVTCLQDYLTGTGHFTFSGGSTGYFGPVTQSAVAAWQAANGVSPAVGYFGPISQARYTAVAGSTTTTTTTTTTTGISTTGVEGTITATLYPTPSTGTKLYEGDSKKAVMGIELEADLSDMRVERIKIQVPSIVYYNEVANYIYVMDGSTVLASSPLNSSTVVKEGSNFFVTLTGVNYVVAKDTKKVLNVAVDGRSVIDSAYTDGDTFSFTIPVNGVRAVDGAGINQYSPATAFSRSHTPTADLADSASIAVSLNSGSPETNQIICTSGSDEDECDELELARIDFKAEDDNIKVTDFVLDLVRGGDTSSATGTVAYIYDGSTVVGSASVAATSATVMTATFSDIDWIVPADTTKTLVVKMDVTDVLAAATTFVASTDAADVTSENSKGSSLTATGSADGKTLTLRKVGPEVTLVSKSITTSGVPQGSTGDSTSTSTLTATFSIKIKAVGGDLLLGKIASGSPVFQATGATFELFENGVTSDSNTATSTSYTIPNTCTDNGTNTCELAENASVTIPVTYQILGREAASTVLTSALYAVQFQGIQWVADGVSAAVQTTTFMNDDEDWRTADVSFP